MITSSTDMVTMEVTLDVHGAKLKLTLQEARQIIVTLSHAILPMDDATVAAVYHQMAVIKDKFK